MWTFSSSKIVRFVLTPLLSLWVAGAGCMLGCEGMVTSVAAAGFEQEASTGLHSAQGVTIVASGHACSSGASSASELNKSHNCCKRSSTEVKPKERRLSPGAATWIRFDSSSSGLMKDCPLARSKTAVVTKSRSSKTDASPGLANSYLPAQDFLEQPTSLSTSARLPNRGHTYLRCCVFLI